MPPQKKRRLKANPEAAPESAPAEPIEESSAPEVAETSPREEPLEPASAKLAWKEGALMTALLLAVYLIPWRGPGWLPAAQASRDTLGNRLIAASWAARGSSDIGPYFAGPIPRLFEEHVLAPRTSGDEPMKPRYPIGTALLAWPFFLGVPANAKACAEAPAWKSLLVRERVAAAFLTALAAGLFHVLIRRRWPTLLSRRQAILATAALGLATPFWSANAGALWTHSGSAPCLAAMLLCLFRPGGRVGGGASFMAAGALAGLAAWCRPTHLATIAVVPLALLISLPWRGKRWRRQGEEAAPGAIFLASAFVMGALMLASLSGLGNAAIYAGDPAGPYLRDHFATITDAQSEAGRSPTRFLLGMAGALFSPGAGLFFHCPIFLLALGGIAAAWRLGFAGRLCLTLALVHLVLIGRNPTWWGGWSWGPRLFADLGPFLMLLCLPTLAVLKKRGRLWMAGALAVAGVFFQWVGIVWFDYGWFFERQSDDETVALLWSPSRSPLPDALRGGKPLGSVEPQASDWRETSLLGPDWLRARLGVLEARVLQLNPQTESGAWEFASGAWLQDRPLPYRPIEGLSWESATQSRDWLHLPLAGAPREFAKGGEVFLMAAFPPGGPRARIVGGATKAELLETRPIQTSGKWLVVYLWRLKLDPSADYLALERRRPVNLSDPLATIPPTELIGAPCFVAPGK